MSVVVERLSDSHQLGEGPHWNEKAPCLYYVDIFGHTIHKYTPSKNVNAKALVGDDTVSLIIPVNQADGKYLISFGRQIGTITWNGVDDKVKDFKKLAEVDTEEGVRDNRINDGKCDASGRLWFGTMGPEPQIGHIQPNKGSLYSMDLSGRIKKHLASITCSNGLAWNADNTKLYYIDSGNLEIHEYDFNLTDAEISNKKVVFRLREAGIDGFADGQTIDADGNLWIAIFNGYKVIKIDPRRYNALLQTVEIPAKQVTSVAFGGPNLDELYVTTASFTVDGVALPPPEHGALYKITGLGVKGVRANCFKM